MQTCRTSIPLVGRCHGEKHAVAATRWRRIVWADYVGVECFASDKEGQVARFARFTRLLRLRVGAVADVPDITIAVLKCPHEGRVNGIIQEESCLLKFCFVILTPQFAHGRYSPADGGSSAAF